MNTASKGNPAQNRQLGADDLPAAENHRPAHPGARQAPQQPHHVPLPSNRQALWARLYRTAAQKTAEKGRNHRKHPLPRIASPKCQAQDTNFSTQNQSALRSSCNFLLSSILCSASL